MVKRIEKIVDNVDEFIDSKLPQSPEAISRRRRVLRFIGGAGLGSLLVLGSCQAYEAVDSPEFSSETHTYTVGPDDEALYPVLRREIDDIEFTDPREANYYVVNMPENKEALSDGLDEGDVLTLPNSVTN